MQSTEKGKNNSDVNPGSSSNENEGIQALFSLTAACPLPISEIKRIVDRASQLSVGLLDRVKTRDLMAIITAASEVVDNLPASTEAADAISSLTKSVRNLSVSNSVSAEALAKALSSLTKSAEVSSLGVTARDDSSSRKGTVKRSRSKVQKERTRSQSRGRGGKPAADATSNKTIDLKPSTPPQPEYTQKEKDQIDRTRFARSVALGMKLLCDFIHRRDGTQASGPETIPAVSEDTQRAILKYAEDFLPMEMIAKARALSLQDGGVPLLASWLITANSECSLPYIGALTEDSTEEEKLRKVFQEWSLLADVQEFLEHYQKVLHARTIPMLEPLSRRDSVDRILGISGRARLTAKSICKVVLPKIIPVIVDELSTDDLKIALDGEAGDTSSTLKDLKRGMFHYRWKFENHRVRITFLIRDVVHLDTEEDFPTVFSIHWGSREQIVTYLEQLVQGGSPKHVDYFVDLTKPTAAGVVDLSSKPGSDEPQAGPSSVPTVSFADLVKKAVEEPKASSEEVKPRPILKKATTSKGVKSAKDGPASGAGPGAERKIPSESTKKASTSDSASGGASVRATKKDPKKKDPTASQDRVLQREAEFDAFLRDMKSQFERFNRPDPPARSGKPSSKGAVKKKPGSG